MTRDRRSAPQQPAFVWEALDTQAREPGAAPGSGREDSPVAAESVAEPAAESLGAETTRNEEHEPGTRRPAGRALIAAAVLVPLAGAAYAAVALSSGHGDTTIVTAGASQIPGLDLPAGSSAGGSPVGSGSGAGASPGRVAGTGTGVGTGAGTGTSPGASTSASGQPSLPPSANTSSTAAAGSTHSPSDTTTTVAATPERTTATSAPPTSKPTATAKPTSTQTKPSRPKCAAAWNPNTSYVPDQVVSYQGQNYTATYYSTDAAPNAAISWDVWTSDGSCS